MTFDERNRSSLLKRAAQKNHTPAASTGASSSNGASSREDSGREKVGSVSFAQSTKTSTVGQDDEIEDDSEDHLWENPVRLAKLENASGHSAAFKLLTDAGIVQLQKHVSAKNTKKRRKPKAPASTMHPRQQRPTFTGRQHTAAIANSDGATGLTRGTNGQQAAPAETAAVAALPYAAEIGSASVSASAAAASSSAGLAGKQPPPLLDLEIRKQLSSSDRLAVHRERAAQSAAWLRQRREALHNIPHEEDVGLEQESSSKVEGEPQNRKLFEGEEEQGHSELQQPDLQQEGKVQRGLRNSTSSSSLLSSSFKSRASLSTAAAQAAPMTTPECPEPQQQHQNQQKLVLQRQLRRHQRRSAAAVTLLAVVPPLAVVVVQQAEAVLPVRAVEGVELVPAAAAVSVVRRMT